MIGPKRSLLLPAIVGATAWACFAQPNRIPSRIEGSRTVVLNGRVHPLANAANDRGAVESGFPLSVTLLLKASPAQQTSLEQLVRRQQDPSSSGYHQWLTPEQYADQFGLNAADTSQIASWLESQGFTVDQVARSRTFIAFSGSAAQMQVAFGTSIHRYSVNGRMHYANASDPTIPAALSGIIAGFRGWNDFHMNPHMRKASLPLMTVSGGAHHIAPDDFSIIYDVAPLYSAGINGAGQSIAVVGQSAIYASDIQAFWNKFNLTTPRLVQQRVTYRPNPGVVSGDVDESSLDIEWSSAVARNASIVFVYSDDVWQSAIYAVDQDLAPVLSISYGSCEPSDLVDLPTQRALVLQANAEGMTWLAAAGDSGAADCDYSATIAEAGMAVDVPAAIPEVTSMGGTEFNESGFGFWNSTNTASGASATAYIPEIAWNDTALGFGFASTGGGSSIYFPQPSWQSAPGVPADGMRHVPDLSFAASADHDGYYFYSSGSGGYVGGTSVAAPTMAGAVALLNQYLVSSGALKQPGVGNLNPTLYRMARNTTGVFHDITGGNNVVPCVAGSPDCVNGSLGYAATAGYDSATGLGSIDVANFVRQWSSQPATGSSVVPSIDQNPVSEQQPDSTGNSWRFKLTLSEEAGIATTLTDFTIDGQSHAGEIQSLFGTTSISASSSITASYGLATVAVPKNVVFGFAGVDLSGAPWSASLAVPFSGPKTRLTVAGISNAASGQQVYAPGMILSVYGTAMGNFAQAAGAIPLPDYLAGFEASVNGVLAPLYYVSANQVNIQIPYETSPGPAVLTVGNPWENVDYNFTVAGAGPGIFTFPDGSVNPSRSAAAGQTVTLFVTGEGQVRPSLATGATPSPNTPLKNLPAPRQAVTVTVGGLPASVQFIGIPSGLVGVTQINFTIPAAVGVGVQPVVVTVGVVASPPAHITIQ